MTEVTEEARKELGVIIASLPYSHRNPLYDPYHANNAMLALDKHHGRTPPDPMVAKAERLLTAGFPASGREWQNHPCFAAFLAQLHKEFPGA